MSIIGKWKVKKVGVFDEELGMQMKTIEEVMAMEETEEIIETKAMATAMSIIVNEESIQMRMIVPPKEIEAAKQEGKEILLNEDGSATVQEFLWKEENGEFFYEMGDEMEIDGEIIDSWLPIEFDEEGYMVMGMLAFEKV